MGTNQRARPTNEHFLVMQPASEQPARVASKACNHAQQLHLTTLCGSLTAMTLLP